MRTPEIFWPACAHIKATKTKFKVISNFQIFLLKTFLIYFNVRVSRSELKLKQTAVTNLMVVTAMSTSEARAKLLELDSRRKSLEEELKLVSHVFLVRILVWLFQQR